jgi:hypothetical protein
MSQTPLLQDRFPDTEEAGVSTFSAGQACRRFTIVRTFAATRRARDHTSDESLKK